MPPVFHSALTDAKGIGVDPVRECTATRKARLAANVAVSFIEEACRLAPGALLVEYCDEVQAGEVGASTYCGTGVKAGL